MLENPAGEADINALRFCPYEIKTIRLEHAAFVESK